MKLFSLISAALLLAGCASSVPRATPEALRAAPGSTWQITSPKPYDAAYRKTLDSMKACYERGGRVRSTVWGDKTETDAQVSMAITSLFTHRIVATIVLIPTDGGTAVALYSAGDQPTPALVSALTTWLVNDGAGCPGDTLPQEAK